MKHVRNLGTRFRDTPVDLALVCLRKLSNIYSCVCRNITYCVFLFILDAIILFTFWQVILNLHVWQRIVNCPNKHNKLFHKKSKSMCSTGVASINMLVV